jgi:hypothetical protein
MNRQYFVIAAILVTLGQLVLWAEAPISTVTFRVIDENGTRVPNANILGTSYWRPGKTKGLSDINGEFSYQDRVYTDVGCLVEKPGYYRTRGEVWHWKGVENEHPTNTLVVVLKRIIDPVPLTFRKIETNLPRLGMLMPFDLEIGDWVEPDGKGKTKDVWFNGEKLMLSRDDHDVRVTVSFSNELNGIREFVANAPFSTPVASDLMPTQIAPSDGYTNRVELWQYWHPGKPMEMRYREDRNYVFRVRCKKNHNDQIMEANCGWIRQDIRIDPRATKTIWMRFYYYYNPNPHSRSLEPKEIADIQGKYPK